MPFGAAPAGADYRRLLILIELKGGNDGLNTLVPFADPAYYALRPKLAIARDSVIQLSDGVGLHPALEPLLPLWRARELAVLQGVGYPEPNLSHFRSIEIWDTASGSHQYLQDGWLTRTFALAPTPADFAADGVIVGSPDLGPLSGGGTRAIALANTEQFLRQARFATAEGQARNKALQHILKVEADIVQAAARLKSDYAFQASFPRGPVRQRDPDRLPDRRQSTGRGGRSRDADRATTRTAGRRRRRRACWANWPAAWSR